MHPALAEEVRPVSKSQLAACRRAIPAKVPDVTLQPMSEYVCAVSNAIGKSSYSFPESSTSPSTKEPPERVHTLFIPVSECIVV